MSETRLFDFDNAVNGGRQDELDMLKATTLWFLILCHAILILKIDWATTNLYEWIFYYASSAVGAQAFMICMGVGMVYSRTQEPSHLMRRGVMLFALGYILNFIRNFLPMFASGAHIYFREEISLFESLFEVDILQFAGLTFLCFGLLKRWKCSDFLILVTMLFFAALGGFLNHLFPMRASVGASLLGLFVFTSELGNFPFFSWFVYPCAGYFFGKILLHCLDKTHLYQAMFLLGLTLTLGFVAGCLQFNIGFDAVFGDTMFYGQNPITAYGLLSISMLWIPMAYFASCRLNKTWIWHTIKRWSANLTAIYIVSWILLGWLAAALEILGYRAYVPQGGWAYFITSVGVFFLSDAIAVGYKRWSTKLVIAKVKLSHPHAT